MAEDLARSPVAAAPVERPLVTPSKERSRLYRGRFALAYLALALVAAGAVGAVFAIGAQPGKQDEAPWSQWRPTGNEEEYPSQIARYVSSRYRLPSGNPLVTVLPERPPKVQEIPLTWVAIRGRAGAVQTDNTVMYILCGLGERCSIREGKPSVARHQVLRREALELALYTFKYVDDVESVIAMLPPRPTARQIRCSWSRPCALFFREEDLRSELARPLALTRSEPPQPAEIAPAEVLTIERLTLPHLFTYRFEPLQDQTFVLVLTPIPQE